MSKGNAEIYNLNSSDALEGAVYGYADLEKAYREAMQGEATPQKLQVSFIPVESSNLKGVQYIPGLEWLLVIFKNNQVYCYTDVPPQAYQELMEAESKGKYFYSNIKGKFEYENLGEVKDAR